MENRRDLLMLAAAALAGGGATPASAAVRSGVVPPDLVRPSMHPFGDKRIFMQGPTEMMKSFESGSIMLKRGQSLGEPEVRVEEEIILVTEGTGEINLDGRATKVAPGSMLFAESGKPHNIANTGDSEMVFYYFRWVKKD